MRYSVYHVTNEALPKVAFGIGSEGVWPTDFKMVAEVEAADLTEVFTLTNTIEHPWWENEGVKAINPPHRSTSVGDVVIDESGDVIRFEVIGYTTIAHEGHLVANPHDKRERRSIS